MHHSGDTTIFGHCLLFSMVLLFVVVVYLLVLTGEYLHQFHFATVCVCVVGNARCELAEWE